MNQNGNEERIRQLFGEMSVEDRRLTPAFVNVMAAARSRGAQSRNRIRPLRFAMVAAMLLAALLIAMAIILRPSTHQGVARKDEQATAPKTAPDPAVVPAQPDHSIASDPGVATVEPRRVVIRHVRHRKPSNQTELAMKSLFAWQSPTASLLKTPSDDLMKSLPKLGESLQTIKSFLLDEFN